MLLIILIINNKSFLEYHVREISIPLYTTSMAEYV